VTEILERLLPSVYRFAVRLTGDTDLAADLAQETFVRAWPRKRHLRDQRATKVWLLTIARNLWCDQLRRKRLRSTRVLPLDCASTIPTPLERTAQVDLAHQVLAAMETLPDRQREVLYLHACEGLELPEIAEIVGIQPGAVKASLSLARKKMRELFPGIHDPTDRLR
jgi:RNA polymerase sigma-70 factor (ECF subfamily)